MLDRDLHLDQIFAAWRRFGAELVELNELPNEAALLAHLDKLSVQPDAPSGARLYSLRNRFGLVTNLQLPPREIYTRALSRPADSAVCIGTPALQHEVTNRSLAGCVDALHAPVGNAHDKAALMRSARRAARDIAKLLRATIGEFPDEVNAVALQLKPGTLTHPSLSATELVLHLPYFAAPETRPIAHQVRHAAASLGERERRFDSVSLDIEPRRAPELCLNLANPQRARSHRAQAGAATTIRLPASAIKALKLIKASRRNYNRVSNERGELVRAPTFLAHYAAYAGISDAEVAQLARERGADEAVRALHLERVHGVRPAARKVQLERIAG